MTTARACGMTEQDQALRLFGRVLSRGRLAHAYLLTGPPGVGKERLARHIAQLFLCADPRPDNGLLHPCGECRHCGKIKRNVHPDLTVVERQGAMIRLDQIRGLQKTVTFQPLEAARRVCLILDANLVNMEASNALLKTLEEPPSGTHLILTAVSPKALLPTIVSRCQVVRCGMRGYEDFDGFLRGQSAVSAEEIQFLSRMAEGSISRAEELLKLDVSGLRDSLMGFLAAPESPSPVRLFAITSEMRRNRERFTVFVQLMRTILRDAMIFAHTGRSGSPGASNFVHRGRERELATLAWLYRWEDLEEMGRRLNDAERLAERNVDPEMLAESALIFLLRNRRKARSKLQAQS